MEVAKVKFYVSDLSGCRKEKEKRTTPGIPTWSPTVVLTRPEHA